MSTVVVLAVGVAIVLGLPIAWRIRAGRFDPFEPIFVFALAWAAMFVVRPIAIVIRDDTDFYGVDIAATLDGAVLLGLMGAVAFVVGYEVSVGTRLASRAPAPPRAVRTLPALAAAVAVGVFGVVMLALVLLPSGGLEALETFLGGRSPELTQMIDGSSIYLWYGSLVVVPAALVAVAVALSDHRRGLPGAVALALVAVALLRTVPTGNRAFLLVLVGGIVVFAFLRVGRRPGALALVLGLFLALFVSRAILTVRDSESHESVAAVVSSFVSTPARALKPLYRGPDAEMAPALAGALTVIPEPLGHRFGGATIGDLVLRPVPRQIWPGKPEPPGSRVAMEVWPVAVETGGFDPAFTPMLAFFWDFAGAGVLLGMAGLGVLARSLRELLVAHPGRFGAQLLFAAALWFLVIAARHDTTLAAVWGCVLFAPMLAILAVASSERASATAPMNAVEGAVPAPPEA